MKILNHVDYAKNEIRNAVVQVLSADPSSPVLGQFYFNSVSGQILTWSGAAFTNKATDSALLNGQAAAFYLARANHTGTQLAATISDFATTAKAITLDQFAAPSADVAFGGHKLTGVADPVNPTDGANRQYVDAAVASAAAGIDSKPSVRVVATANIALTAVQTIDGVTLVAGDRVLATAQTTATQNGVYVVASGAWTRALDADATGEITPGAFWFVEEGTTNAASQWRCANTGTVTLNTTAISITQFGASTSYTATNGVQLVGNVLSIKLPAASGLLADGTGLHIDTSVVARKFSQAIGDGTTTAIVVTHNLGTLDVAITVRDTSGNVVFPDMQATSTNTVTLTFATAPAAAAYRVTVVG